jgi:hypothetical protein
MAGGAANSAAPTNKARDDMPRAIKVRLFGWPATIRLTPDLSARLTRGIRPWKGLKRVYSSPRMCRETQENRWLCAFLCTLAYPCISTYIGHALDTQHLQHYGLGNPTRVPSRVGLALDIQTFYGLGEANRWHEKLKTRILTAARLAAG